MRTKKAIYNNIAAALLQVTILIFGLITPRLMIRVYGSELNGLISSTKQITSYMKYLELGITASLVYTLYQPVAYRRYDSINPLVARARREYQKISLWYSIGVVLMALIYPLMLKENLNYGFVIMLIFLIGIFGALDYLSLSKYRVLLMADQKEYVLNITTTVWTVLHNLISIILIMFSKSVLLVVFIPTMLLPLRGIILKIYVNKNYSLVNFKETPSKIKLDSRKDAFLSGLSNGLTISLPIVMVSLIVSLEMTSVYAVYSMVFVGLTGVMNVFNMGMSAAFGNMYAKEEKESMIRNNNYYEFLLYIIITILYSLAFALIIPFIKIYTANVADINYVIPIVGILFTLWSVLQNARIPNETIINSTGNWKAGRYIYITQIILLIIGTLVLGYFFSIVGILIGMILSTTFKSISIIYISNQKILEISSTTTFKRLFRVLFVITIVNLPLLFNFYSLPISNFFQWLIAGIIIFIYSTIITFIINYLFEKKTMINIYNRFIKNIITRKKTK